MNRRKFLQSSSFILPGLSIAGMLGTKPAKLFAAADTSANSLSLAVVTDRPDKAVTQIQELLSGVNFPHKTVRYTEYILHGNHTADIAFTHAGRLVDFRKENGPLCAGLRSIAERLDLPRSCENPLLAHFSCDAGIHRPAGIRVFKQNELIIEKEFPARKEEIFLDGVHGKLVLEIGADRSVHIAESSCAHKTCMTMGSISQAGQNLVCIPNQIAVTISGTDLSGIDSVTF